MLQVPTAGGGTGLNGAPSPAANPNLAAAISSLREKARQQGKVRVIVGLAVTMRPEDQLTLQQIGSQRAALGSAQDRVTRHALAGAPVGSVKRYRFIPFIAMTVDETGLAGLASDPLVRSIEEDSLLSPNLGQSTAIIKAPDLWAAGNTGSGYTVAVLDTGVDKTHPMLTGKVVSEACYGTNDGTNIVSLCPGAAAYSTVPGSGVNCPNSIKGCDHGTHVASIAAGFSISTACNGDCKGVAPDANIISIKVFSRVNVQSVCVAAGYSTSPCVGAYNSDILQGVERVYVLRRKFRIAATNLSLGGVGLFDRPCEYDTSDQNAYTFAFRMLRSANIAPIIASGNDGYDGYVSSPACNPEAIAVGATTKSDDVASYSNMSALVKLMAPGDRIVAAIPSGAKCPQPRTDGYCEKSGTSMAAPHVAGAFALLRYAKPSATPEEILAALYCTGVPVVRIASDDALPRPRIDVAAAKDYLLNPPATARQWQFTTTADAANWAPINSTWAVAGGKYLLRRPTVDSRSVVASAVYDCDETAQVTAKMRRVDPSGAYFSGLFVNTSIDLINGKASGYWFVYSKSGGGSAGAYRVNNAPLKYSSSLFYPNFEGISCGRNLAINQDQYNTLTVTTGGGYINFYLNSSRICTLRDSAYAIGHVMVATQYPDIGSRTGHSFAVDEVTIEPLQ